MGFSDFLSIVSLFINAYIAIRVPKIIMWIQLYTSLTSEYRNYEFARALKDITDFFIDDCNKDFSKIKDKYYLRFCKDFKNEDSEKLHFQRRLLTQYYLQFDTCITNCRLIRALLKKDYTKTETNLVKILYYMGKAVEELPHVYRDITTSDPLFKEYPASIVDKHLYNLYKILKKEIGE